MVDQLPDYSIQESRLAVGLTPLLEFEIGETVKINHGPFEGNNGIVEEIDPEKGRLKVTVNIFGRNTPVDVEYWEVDKG